MKSRLNQIQNWHDLAQNAQYNAKELAKKCGVSPRQLQRFFLLAAGKSPQKWLNTLRLKKAVSLMENGQTVKEAASELKYKQRSHFSRVYKRFHGVPPSSAQFVSDRHTSLRDTVESLEGT